MSFIANSSTCTKRRSFATRSISATASSGLCGGTRIDARNRGSRSSSSFATQSFTAEHSAIAMSSLNSATAPCSTLQIAIELPNGSSAWRRIASRSPAGAPDRLPPVRPRAERRVRRIARQRERIAVDVAVDDLVAPVFADIGQQRRCARHRRMQIAIDRAFATVPSSSRQCSVGLPRPRTHHAMEAAVASGPVFPIDPLHRMGFEVAGNGGADGGKK